MDNKLNCDNKYKKFIKSGNFQDIEDCYYEYPTLNDVIVTDKPNPLDQSETCKLINTKKDSYYKFTYDPNKIIDDFRKCATPIYQNVNDYVNNVEQIIDPIIKTNCCNCISISLYYDRKPLTKYLISIKRTIKNVGTQLPDWIIRLYFDISVFRYMKLATTSSEEMKILDFIMTASNVEVYTYVCNKLLLSDDKPITIPISQTRSFRYLPLIDGDTNICIIREADGIVTNLDCHNIRVFAESSQLFYLLPLIKSANRVNGFKIPYESYSTWLTWYKTVINPEYFSNKNNVYDLLAGTFGTKIKIKPTIYFEYIDKITNMINEEEFRSDYVFDKANLVGSSTVESLITGLIPDYKSVDDVQNILDIGFDEILLLAIYKDLISFQFTKTSINMFTYSDSTVKLIDCIFLSNNNISTIRLNDTHNEETIDNVVKLLGPYIKINDKTISYIKDMYKMYDDIDKQDKEVYKEIKVRTTGEIRRVKKSIEPYKSFILAYIVDSLLRNNCIITDTDPFNITVYVERASTIVSVLDLVNEPYNEKYDPIYDVTFYC